MRYFQPIALAIVVLFMVILITGCGTRGFTAVFEKSAPVVRGWGEACIANNLTKADEYLSLDTGGDLRPAVCSQLANHPSRDKLLVLSVEDAGSLIGSNNLSMRIKNRVTGKSITITVYLVNTEQGVRISAANTYSSLDYLR